MVDFLEAYQKKKQAIEKYIHEDLKGRGEAYEKIIDAMAYSVLNGGKRLRPVLLLSAFELFSENWENALPFCAAIEYIHCYSLIHDDLPAMDNDDLRRGRPTCHKQFNEGIAILAGDALLNLAYEKMLSSPLPQALEAARVIAAAAGKDGMIGGQVIDIENEGKTIPLKLLNELHALKTGALIRGALIAGAVLGGGSSKDAELLGEFGSLLGLSFQIQDDILDVTGNEETLGKPVHSDEKNQKTTYLSHFTIEECREIIRELTKRSENILSSYAEEANFLITLSRDLMNREK